MVAFLIALIPLLEQLLGGASLAAVLGTITLAQWVKIGTDALAAGPQVMAALPKIIAAVHPALADTASVFDRFMADLANTKDPELSAANIQKWIAGNANVAISLQPGAGDA